ncbi:hypothetical protein ABK040_007504 [Willaertia magna]
MESSSSENKSETKIDLEFEVVQHGIYGHHAKDFRDALLISSTKDCSNLGLKKEVETQTNFDENVLIYVASGSKPTGGYSVQVKKVQYDNEKQAVVVHAKDAEPKNSFGTMALTLPFQVVRIKKTSEHPLDKVKLRWMKKKEKK